MKNVYELPEMEIINLSNEDVITTSNGVADPINLGNPKTYDWADLT